MSKHATEAYADAAGGGGGGGGSLIEVSQRALTSSQVGTYALYDMLSEAPVYVDAIMLASGGVQNDYLEYPVNLDAGTWSLRLHYRKSSNIAIYTVQLDGVTLGTIDGYSAAPQQGIGDIVGISVATSGVKLLKLLAATKNASSSSYILNLFSLSLLKTA